MKKTSILIMCLVAGPLSACAGAFDDASSHQDTAAVQLNGKLHTSRQALESGEPPIIRQETQPNPASAGTPLHEPNNGWWYEDKQDQESQVHYDSCSGAANAIEITQVAYRSEVNPTDKTFTFSNVLTDTILLERFGWVKPDGQPYEPGDLIGSGTCDYVSSFADCSDDEPTLLLSFAATPYGYDADLYSKTSNFVYFDYGQQRFRQLLQTEMWCEGADCALPFPASIVPNGRCSASSMKVWRRAAAPTFIYRDYSAQ